MADKMEIEILGDGSLKIETDKISGPNHMNAEAFLRFLTEEAGGKQQRIRKPQSHHHHHHTEELNQ